MKDIAILPQDIAKIFDDKGADVSVRSLNGDLFLPLCVAQDFLRGKGIHVDAEPGVKTKNGRKFRCCILDDNNPKFQLILDNDYEDYDTYEEALTKGLEQGIKMI
ncbi:MAG: hypothetical protein J6J23_05805 [Clostridia bacterium]|nr:hypothetical protein [Clostridia bacterium]